MSEKLQLADDPVLVVAEAMRVAEEAQRERGNEHAIAEGAGWLRSTMGAHIPDAPDLDVSIGLILFMALYDILPSPKRESLLNLLGQEESR